MAATSAAQAKRVSARSKARRRALEILYEADLRDDDPVSILEQRLSDASSTTSDYAAKLVRGIMAARQRIDELIETYAEGWTLTRMPVVDRAILRIGVYELRWCDDIPDAVAIDEAVELAKSLSTEDSHRFINGILARIARSTLLGPRAGEP